MLPSPALLQGASAQLPPAQISNAQPKPGPSGEHTAIRHSLKGVSTGNVRAFDAIDRPVQSPYPSSSGLSQADASMMTATTATTATTSGRRPKLVPTPAQECRERSRIDKSRVFWDIYMACDIDGINDVLSGNILRLNPNDIVARLSEIDDARVVGLAKNGTHLKTEIKHIASKDGLTEIAKAMHVCSGTKNPPRMALHARLEMTSNAMTLLSDYCEAGIPIKLNRFIPCAEKALLSEIAPLGKFMTQLTINGYSAKPIDSHFNIWSPYKSMLSPLAICRIKDMVVDRNKMIATMILEEIGSAKNAAPMPY